MRDDFAIAAKNAVLTLMTAFPMAAIVEAIAANIPLHAIGWGFAGGLCRPAYKYVVEKQVESVRVLIATSLVSSLSAAAFDGSSFVSFLFSLFPWAEKFVQGAGNAPHLQPFVIGVLGLTTVGLIVDIGSRVKSKVGGT